MTSATPAKTDRAPVYYDSYLAARRFWILIKEAAESFTLFALLFPYALTLARFVNEAACPADKTE